MDVEVTGVLCVQFKVCHGSLYAVMWLADEPREFNLPTLPQRRITYVPEKLPSKYGVHSEEYLPILRPVYVIDVYKLTPSNGPKERSRRARDLTVASDNLSAIEFRPGDFFFNVEPVIRNEATHRKIVCFSDESTFQYLMDKAMFVRRRKGESFPPGCLVNTVKHPMSVMIWSVISGKGSGRLYIVQGTMKQDQYIQVLENRLILELNEWFPNGEKYIFMQDGAHCHTARRVKKFLASKNIPLLPWPGNSPDLNPIENV
ncbi:hypothetical protein ANN_09177 [Periplaneta americana]|uniref:Tc1-like transposase DDE domain-containing protein n=1 Tax=Periplaneta americana TaxID=6978 RepID=A0ABQ8TKN0_PERAM|nr:hypothetical protein ANN_09177 [Periplaneta americana]